MFRNNIIQPVNQFWFPEPDVRGAFLKVSDAEHLIFIAFFTLNRPDVIIQTNSDVFPVTGLKRGYRLAELVMMHEPLARQRVYS